MDADDSSYYICCRIDYHYDYDSSEEEAMTDKNSEFIRLILILILCFGSAIGGITLILRTGWESSSDARAKVVREYFDGCDRLVKTIFSQFD